MNRPDYSQEIRRSLTDPRRVCEALGLAKNARKQTSGVIVCCPAHREKSPSCSVTRGGDGTIRVRCFGCGWTGDVLTLVAQVHDLDVRNSFREVLLEAAQIGGLHAVVDELRGKAEWKPRELPPAPESLPENEYPPVDEVTDVWEAGDRSDPIAKSYLGSRRIDLDAATQLGLLSVLPPRTSQRLALPCWAHYGASSWQDSGHRLIVPVFDHLGARRSLRAWRIEGTAAAKRVPPVGCKATGLMMANRPAVELLKTLVAPRRVVVVEGEPDFAVAAIRWSHLPIFGVVNGGWTEDFAARIPLGSEVILATHHDEAGERYAQHVAKTVRDRAVVMRSAAA